jgi:acyl-CoA dehydrogenase
MLGATADELFADSATRETLRDGWATTLWERAVEIGLSVLEVPEQLGGAGGDVANVATVLRAAGRHLAQIPLASTNAAAWALAQAGVPAPIGPLAVALAEGEEFRFTHVAYARRASALVVVRRDRLDLIGDFAVSEAENLAGEPRDTVDARPGTCHSVDGAVLPGVESRLALARAAETVGALEAVCRITIEHARTREQFGVPIARLAVVRERLALLAEEVASADAALDVARLALARGPAEVAVAAAKVRSAEAATHVARLAHQLHGAIGVTTEHVLQLYTRRLWAWRDEDGSERSWAARLGRALAAGDLWQRVVEEAPV